MMGELVEFCSGGWESLLDMNRLCFFFVHEMLEFFPDIGLNYQPAAGFGKHHQKISVQIYTPVI